MGCEIERTPRALEIVCSPLQGSAVCLRHAHWSDGQDSAVPSWLHRGRRASAHDQIYERKKEYILRAKIIPTAPEAVCNPVRRPAVVDEFQGMLLAHLPTTGKPVILSHQYRMADSR
ncbi:hypothetical protein [Streptomyces ortus]|uniref:Uncharacterized protein n=1 Tax=Streptomyces ortus TaxID=2867268 RepID=A0ABT3V0J1_9ACTN|nr:hypothetical protein [Streptomyces ortus]MCX4233260.1 hypothetical protein [Streptomyces ortus]